MKMRSILQRVINALFEGVCFFIILSVMFKLFMKNEQWLYVSVFWSVAWAIGKFIAKSFRNTNGAKGVVLFNITVISFVFIALSFILGVILDLKTWGEIVAYITFPFGISIYSNSN